MLQYCTSCRLDWPEAGCLPGTRANLATHALHVGTLIAEPKAKSPPALARWVREAGCIIGPGRGESVCPARSASSGYKLILLSSRMADCEQFEALHERVAGSLDAVGRFLVGLLEAPQGEHRPPQLLALDAELQKFWKTYADLKQRHSHQSLQVAVLALTKSGTTFGLCSA